MLFSPFLTQYASTLFFPFFYLSVVELLAGVIMVCANIGYPIGLLYEKFGPGACYGLSGVLGFVSCFMIYWATFDYQYYTQHVWLLALFYGLYGTYNTPGDIYTADHIGIEQDRRSSEIPMQIRTSGI